MSLETLLEAAEFLESRGKVVDRQKHRTLSDRRTNSFSEQFSNLDGSECNDTDEKVAKEPKTKNKSGAGTREVHNKLEKNRKFTQGKELAPFISSAHNWLERNRRAHLKECFDFLKKNIPSLEDKRISNLGILRSSLRYIQNLKRREHEFELEMQKFAREKILLQERMHGLKDELHNMDIDVDINAWVTSSQDHDNETNSTSTATERGTPPPSDFDENDDDEEEAERLVLETNPSPTPKNNKNNPNAVRPLIPVAIPKTAVPMINGVIPKVNQILLKSPSKKTIPITLSLSGPVQPVSYMANLQPQNIPETVQVSRTPVTQLLHRTLTQRQALQKQIAVTSAVSSAPLTIAQLKSPPLARNIIPVSFGTVNSSGVSSVTPKVELSTTPIPNAVGTNITNVALTNQAPSVSSAVPVTVPYYMASVQKIAHPILVTSLMTPAVGLTTSTNSSSTLAGSVVSSSNIVSSITPKAELKLETGTSLATQTPFNILTTPVVTNSITQSEVKTTSATMPMRPIFAPNLLSGWPLLTTIPRSTVVVPSSTVPGTHSVSSVTTTSAGPSIPLVSLAQINQLSQMMTPMTVMSPGIQMTQSTINASQLNTMFATSPLLKQILPLGIPSSLLQSGQVLGQVKPVVVVTVPNVVTQTPMTLGSVAIATTTS